MTRSEMVNLALDYFLEHFPAKKKAGLEFINGFVSELEEQGVVEFEDEEQNEEEPLDVEW